VPQTLYISHIDILNFNFILIDFKILSHLEIR